MPITCQRIGRPPISTSAFGTDSVRSRSRVPRPPQRITTGGFIDCVFYPTGVGTSTKRSAAGHRGQNGYLVAVVDRRLKPLLEADVLAADVDVDEAAKVAVLGDAVAEAAVGVEDRVEHLAHGRAFDFELGVAAGGGAQLRGDLHGDTHLDGYLLRELGLEALEGGVDLVHLERIARRVERLQTLAGDVDDDPLAVGQLAPFGQLAQDADGDAAGGLGEDAGRLRQQLDPFADLLVGDRIDAAAGAARVLDRVRAVGGITD